MSVAIFTLERQIIKKDIKIEKITDIVGYKKLLLSESERIDFETLKFRLS
jgi:hypothetical protein